MQKKNTNRVIAHGCHIIPVPLILLGLGIVSWPLSMIGGYQIVGSIGVIAAIIEYVGHKNKWFK